MQAVISNTAGSATLRSTQLYAPYGSRLFQDQSMSAYTTKGFTGQYNDPTSGLDYYVSRYYDPVASIFLSADIKAGNMQGMNPYGYVGGNPETTNDPSGQMFAPPRGGGGSSSSSSSNNNSNGCSGWWCWNNVSNFFHQTYNVMKNVQHAKTVIEFQALDFLTGYSAMGNDIQTMNNDQASFRDKYAAGVDLLTNLAMDALLLTGVGEEARAGDLVEKGAADVGQQLLHTAEDGLTHLGCSFTSATLVATVLGRQPIGTLHVGDKVLAYNPKTHKMEMQPILHVWIHPDNDLVDLTITTPAKGAPNATLKATSEVVHTNQKHPFLTTEHGFLPVSQIKVGMHIVRADGRIGVITKWTIVPGVKMMYNLEVAQDHTFTVGDGQWVVHNCGGLPQQVEARAREIGENIGGWSKRYLTIGVAAVEDGDGIRTIVATNEKASSSLVNLVKAQLNPGEELVSLADQQGRHAEQVLVQYARENGLNIRGLGASIDFCNEICGPMLIREVGQEFLGQPWPRP